jgi:hypothetical protein
MLGMKSHKHLMMRLSDEVLFDLEKRLGEPFFMGVPIGCTLKACLCERFLVSPVAALKAFLGWGKFYCFGHRECQPLPHMKPRRALLTWLADTPRLNDLVLPVLTEMGQSECNILGGDSVLRKYVSADVGFCSQNQICKGVIHVWRSEYRRSFCAWNQTLLGWLRDHRLPLLLFPHLAYALAVRSLYICGFYKFLGQVQPSVILTDSEHNHPWSCLILVARRLNIPTIQMMHGVIYNAYGYSPLLSDVALCWGRQQWEQMISFGTDPSRLVITGCQRLSRENRCNGKEVRRRLGLPLEKPIVMLATNPMPREEWQKLVFTFGDAFLGNDDFIAIVKLHPSEKRNKYRKEISKYPMVRFFESLEWSVEESMAVCDVVVSHNSGLGNDALVFGRPVVLLDVLEEPLNNGQYLADKAGCPIARSANELHHLVNRIISDRDYAQGLHRQAENYVTTWFCSSFGPDASRNVVAEVRKRMGGPEKV